MLGRLEALGGKGSALLPTSDGDVWSLHALWWMPWLGAMGWGRTSASTSPNNDPGNGEGAPSRALL